MSFGDVIEKFLSEGRNAGDLTTSTIAITLGWAVLLGVFVYIIYRFTSKSEVYNRSFNKTLAILPLITAGILLAMQSNLIISLGMVGALSIVRFRNAVKEPMDLMFLFWSISIGIITGAGLYKLAIVVSLAATVAMFALDAIPAFRAPCLLVVSLRSIDDEFAVIALIKKYCKRIRVRSRNVSNSGMELAIEVLVRNEHAFLAEIADVDGMISANLLSHDGEIRF